MLDRENVVLVTGAGASRPYGYPTGEELTREIIEGLRERNSPLSRAVGLAVPEEPDLRDLARRLAASDRGSVDAFLQPDCNAGLRDAARAAIAWILLSREKQVSRPQDGDWIRYLFGAMLDDVRSPDDLRVGACLATCRRTIRSEMPATAHQCVSEGDVPSNQARVCARTAGCASSRSTNACRRTAAARCW